MTDELRAALAEFGESYSSEAKVTDLGGYARHLNEVIAPFGFFVSWDSKHLVVFVRHDASGKEARMRVSEIQISPKYVPLRAITRIEHVLERLGPSGQTVMVKNVLIDNPLVVSDGDKDSFFFEFDRGEQREIPLELLDHPAFVQGFTMGFLSRVDQAPHPEVVRLDINRTDARRALKSLRMTIEMALDETSGENERNWRIANFGLGDAVRLANALENAIGPEQTVGCPDCNNTGSGEDVVACHLCQGDGCSLCDGGAIQVQVPCPSCGGSGEIHESIFD